MFGGNCLPQVRMCGFFSIQQAVLEHVLWSGLQTHRSWVETRIHNKGVKETGKAFIFIRQWKKPCREGRFVQSRRKLLRTLRKEYSFTIRGGAYWPEQV